ncbi:MAG: phosphoglucomutase/phosphomannomutase family protein [Chloroflexi bacterium]|nr:phosphoglucomutase/phosphomannomutase family protein [Chloroflexota bacterium]
MAQIKFGTDGWRAAIAEDYTFENVRKVSQALVTYMQAIGREKDGLVVGYDTRFNSEHFAAAVAEVAAANGIHTYLTHSFTPTPVISHAIIEKKAGMGAVITASHNPSTDNGFKVKPHYGGSASPEIIAEIEKRLDSEVKRMPFNQALKEGLVEYFDPSAPYFAQLGRMVDLEAIKAADLTLVVDAMYGAGQGYFPRILTPGNVTVAELHGTRNPIFPGMHNPEPIARNLGELIKLLTDSPSSEVGIANDGDADRVGIVDENGRFMNQLEVFALLALYLLEVKGERGPIIKSVSTTSMVDRLGQLYGVEVHETPVGFKYIGPKMMETNALIGGEESGGFGFRGHIPERDGILSGLFIADMMIKLKKTASELLQYLFDKVGPHYYDRIDLQFEQGKRNDIIQHVRHNPPKTIAGIPVIRQHDEEFKYYTEDGSWLLIRFSGTEPILRVYTETIEEAKVQAFLDEGRKLTGV